MRAANTDERFVSAVAWQAGQVGVSLPRTSNSKWCEHSSQEYSYRGMKIFYDLPRPSVPKSPRPQVPGYFIKACGGPMSCDFGAPALGWNFCVRPPKVSATYRLPWVSTENWWMAQNAPGNVP